VLLPNARRYGALIGRGGGELNHPGLGVGMATPITLAQLICTQIA
jgi:hypothetical protein